MAPQLCVFRSYDAPFCDLSLESMGIPGAFINPLGIHRDSPCPYQSLFGIPWDPEELALDPAFPFPPFPFAMPAAGCLGSYGIAEKGIIGILGIPTSRDSRKAVVGTAVMPKRG